MDLDLYSFRLKIVYTFVLLAYGLLAWIIPSILVWHKRKSDKIVGQHGTEVKLTLWFGIKGNQIK